MSDRPLHKALPQAVVLHCFVSYNHSIILQSQLTYLLLQQLTKRKLMLCNAELLKSVELLLHVLIAVEMMLLLVHQRQQPAQLHKKKEWRGVREMREK